MNKHGTRSRTGEGSSLRELKPNQVDLQSETTSRNTKRSEGHKLVEFFRVTVYEGTRQEENAMQHGLEKEIVCTQTRASFPSDKSWAANWSHVDE